MTSDAQNTNKRRLSLQLKIVIGIFLIILTITFVILLIAVGNQVQQVRDTSDTTLGINAQMLATVIRNIMLAGEAPIAVKTVDELKSTLVELELFNIYRVDGTLAFHDFNTLDYVNSHQTKFHFIQTPRVENQLANSDAFNRVLDTKAPLKLNLPSAVDYYFPIINQPDCRFCHGTTNFIRGIAHFRISIAETIDTINRGTFILSSLIILTGIGISLLLVAILRSLIIRPLGSIGKTVMAVGKGDLKVRSDIHTNDELGDLGKAINDMIKGLEERFRLSKYVSRSTDSLVRRGTEDTGASEKRTMTILFSDIRNFTPYTESNPAETVVENLNRILEIQAEAVRRNGGDIDKFVGDAIMAQFNDPMSAIVSAYEQIMAVERLAFPSGRNNGTLHIGVGIATGEVIVGNIGSSERLEYAVIGDTVNLASRFSGLAKANMILVSVETWEVVKEHVVAEKVENLTVKGKNKPLEAYVIKKIRVRHRDEQ